MDRIRAQRIRHRVLEALQEVGEAEDVSFSLGRGTFTRGYVSMKMTAADVLTDGTVLDPERVAFTTYAANYNLDPLDLDKEFTWNGRTYRITGLSQRRSRYPIGVEREDGRKIKMSAQLVVDSLVRSGQ